MEGRRSLLGIGWGKCSQHRLYNSINIVKILGLYTLSQWIIIKKRMNFPHNRAISRSISSRTLHLSWCCLRPPLLTHWANKGKGSLSHIAYRSPVLARNSPLIWGSASETLILYLSDWTEPIQSCNRQALQWTHQCSTQPWSRHSFPLPSRDPHLTNPKIKPGKQQMVGICEQTAGDGLMSTDYCEQDTVNARQTF